MATDELVRISMTLEPKQLTIIDRLADRLATKRSGAVRFIVNAFAEHPFIHSPGYSEDDDLTPEASR
ncbi:MAG: hypothetical protein ABIH03_16085 [Pseudomonadota bacterium]